MAALGTPLPSTSARGRGNTVRRVNSKIAATVKFLSEWWQRAGGTPALRVGLYTRPPGCISRLDDDRLVEQTGRFFETFALSLETQLNASRSAESSRTSEYVKLQERQDALMKSLKSTRDQRIKELEKSDMNFISVIKSLTNRDVQEREGRQMELMKMAGKKEYRLVRAMS